MSTCSMGRWSDMARTYVVEVIVTEEDTGFVYAENDDEVPYEHLADVLKELRNAVVERVNAGREL